MILAACAIPDAHHRGYAARTGCFLGSRKSRSQPSRYPRTRSDASPRSFPLVPIHPPGLAMLWRAGQASMSAAVAESLVDVSSLRSSGKFGAAHSHWSYRSHKSHPSLREPRRFACGRHIATALFGVRPTADSSAWPPLHFNPRPLQMKQAPAALRSAGCQLPRPPMKTFGRTHRHRRARCSACRPTHRLSREHDQLCFAALTN